MSMKATDLEKNKGLKINSRLKQGGVPDRFGAAAGSATNAPDRREQRRLDQLNGVVPFAVKIESALAQQLREMAQAQGVGLNELVSELLRKGLEEKA